MSDFKLSFDKNGASVSDIECFDPEQIFDCGQCFRFDKISESEYSGIAFGRKITVKTLGKNKYLFENITEKDFPKISSFFALDEDYSYMRSDILKEMRHSGTDTQHMEEAMEYGKGIRILRQEKWETLCSFIISQNNNIPRIKKIVKTVCERFGEPFATSDGKTEFAFPSAKAVFNAGEDAIFDCRTGFRAKYIMSAAEKVADSEAFLESLTYMPYTDAVNKLTAIKGVGPKVASCMMLFGCHSLSAFPIDVWVKRIMEKYYPGEIKAENFGRFAGLAQQYLFYYERSRS